MEFIRYLGVILFDIILSGITSFFLLSYMLNETDKSSSCGTGSLGDVLGAWVITFVAFLIFLFIYGSILFWMFL